MQPFSNLPELLTTSCSQKTMIYQTAQELSC